MRSYFAAASLLLMVNAVAAQQFGTPASYTSHQVWHDQMFGVNYAPSDSSLNLELDTLMCDIYAPQDGQSNRPVVILLHGGVLRDRGVFLPFGDKTDSSVVWMSRDLTCYGYVVMNINYRTGWYPYITNSDTGRASNLQAIYRGVQDIHTAIRYLKKTYNELGNPYGIDQDKIALFGVGSGGTISLHASAVTTVDELLIPKFRDPISQKPFIDTGVIGDLYGVTNTVYNVPNHSGYSSEFQFTFGLGGFLTDSSFISTGALSPIAAGGIVNAAVTPFGVNQLGEIDCEPNVLIWPDLWAYGVSGPACVLHHANDSINAPLLEQSDFFNDEVSVKIRNLQFAQEHLWPLHGLDGQDSPWEFWDSTEWNIPSPLSGLSVHDVGLLTNPDMSYSKARSYVDTAVAFFVRRACYLMAPEYCTMSPCSTSSSDLNISTQIKKSVAYPNPSAGTVTIESTDRIKHVTIHDISGRIIKEFAGYDNRKVTCDMSVLPSGLYLAYLHCSNGAKQIISVSVIH